MQRGGLDVEVETVPLLLLASSLIGTKVQNSRGEDLGKIEDVVLDRQHACIAYAVLSSGDLLGLGDRRLAIPWQTLTLDPSKGLILNLGREALENAPTLDRGDRLDGIDAEELRGIYIYYGHSPYWEGP
jgi:hypothetical protein